MKDKKSFKKNAHLRREIKKIPPEEAKKVINEALEIFAEVASENPDAGAKKEKTEEEKRK